MPKAKILLSFLNNQGEKLDSPNWSRTLKGKQRVALEEAVLVSPCHEKRALRWTGCFGGLDLVLHLVVQFQAICSSLSILGRRYCLYNTLLPGTGDVPNPGLNSIIHKFPYRPIISPVLVLSPKSNAEP
jgi:hypothetical protein